MVAVGEFASDPDLDLEDILEGVRTMDGLTKAISAGTGVPIHTALEMARGIAETLDANTDEEFEDALLRMGGWTQWAIENRKE